MLISSEPNDFSVLQRVVILTFDCVPRSCIIIASYNVFGLSVLVKRQHYNLITLWWYLFYHFVYGNRYWHKGVFTVILYHIYNKSQFVLNFIIVNGEIMVYLLLKYSICVIIIKSDFNYLNYKGV